ncbi:TetR/AcrR family transcriptional regulator [Rhodoferax sp. WC2427]|uniref:TetR/AcrR family transcriptional regulator n=1 Tax=Rhodoferax sp. WC2427 TaxID=3234144 RepID=UPI003466D3F4
MNKAEEKPGVEDHRVRVGAQRREATRLRLIESALTVLAEKGPDTAAIEDFIAAAQVSRGTFYNYFRTTSELLLAVAGGMSDEILQVVDPAVRQFSDPVARFSAGSRLYMQTAMRYPLWGAFITRVGTRVAARGQLIDVYLNRDLLEAIAQQRLKIDNVRVARDVVLGTIFFGIETMLTEPTHDHHPEQMMRCVLTGFGLPEAEAEAIAFAPLPLLGDVQGPIFSRLTPVSAGPAAAKRARKPASTKATK